MDAAVQTLWSIFNGFMLPYPLVRQHSNLPVLVKCSLAYMGVPCLLHLVSIPEKLTIFRKAELLLLCLCRCQWAGRYACGVLKFVYAPCLHILPFLHDLLLVCLQHDAHLVAVRITVVTCMLLAASHPNAELVDCHAGGQWLNRISPATWIIYGLAVDQMGENTDQLVTPEGQVTTVKDFLASYFGYEYSFRWCALALQT